jgi:streptomycin 6-kinase
MTEQFIQNALHRSKEGVLWLESIPDLISEFERKWNIRIGAPFALSYNYVAPARLHDGSPAVLKIGFPTDKEFQTEIDALRIYDGEGIVKLLNADEARAVLLIERLEPGIPLRELQDDEQATKIMASVMKKLWKPLLQGHTFPHVSDWAKGIGRYREKFGRSSGPLRAYLVDKADDLFQELIGSTSEAVLVHGDLHHGNVLSAQRNAWLAIDPKGVAAEPAYETAAMLRNPEPELLKKSDLKHTLRKRIVILSEALSLDAKRIQKWGIAQTVLSVIWSIEDQQQGRDDTVVIAELLNKIRI